MKNVLIIILLSIPYLSGCEIKTFTKVKMLGGHVEQGGNRAQFKKLKKSQKDELKLNWSVDHKNYAFAELDDFYIAINPRLTAYQDGITFGYLQSKLEDNQSFSVRNDSVFLQARSDDPNPVPIAKSGTFLSKLAITDSSNRKFQRGVIQTSYRSFPVLQNEPMRLTFSILINESVYDIVLEYMEVKGRKLEPLIGAPASP